MKACISCGAEIQNRNTYCNNKCQADYAHTQFVSKWLDGSLDGSRGSQTKNFSGHVVRYLREAYGSSCVLCGWNEVHPNTGRVPLEIDHIDGDSTNNSVQNLRLICPNCHSLTPTYRNLNYGNGRKWRKSRYLKV